MNPEDAPADPNADLIGQEINVEGTVYIVTGTSTWSTQYLHVASRSGRESCIQAAYVRSAMLRAGS